MSQALLHYGGLKRGYVAHPKLVACLIAAIVSTTASVPLGMLMAQYFVPAPTVVAPLATPLRVDRPLELPLQPIQPTAPQDLGNTMPTPLEAQPSAPAIASVPTETARPSAHDLSAPAITPMPGVLPNVGTAPRKTLHNTGIFANPHEAVIALLRSMSQSKINSPRQGRVLRDHTPSKSISRPAPSLAGNAIMTEPDAAEPFGRREPAMTALGGPAAITSGTSLNGTGMRHRL